MSSLATSMSVETPSHAPKSEVVALSPKAEPENPVRKACFGDQPAIFTDIYQDNINIAVWQNAISSSISEEAKQLLKNAANLKVVMTTDADNVVENLLEQSAELNAAPELCQHIALLVDMFCTLFELKRVGLRLTHLTHAMCPKFHVDKVPCRLVTTFTGNATEWLPNNVVDRTKLGFGGKGLPDNSSGVIRDLNHINQLAAGDVALLKGESWYNNEGGGIVHRSPSLSDNEQRLLLTLDFSD
ncbi:DUF1826 domain-containing protein [Thalassotalea euphylliae]|nr:DUF1826 domain-containing protein [Thalassotalea euphylliae]